MHYFFYRQLNECAENTSVKLDKEEAEHLFHILRAEKGEHVGLLDGQGLSALAEVADGKTLRILSLERVPRPALRIHLYTAVPRKQKMEQLLKQAAELGVYRIVPLRCERSVALPSGERIAKRCPDLLAEACKQSRNPYLPRMEEPMDCLDAVRNAAEVCPVRFFGDPSDTGSTEPLTGDAAYFVGPEGGFTREETDAMRGAGFHPIRIGHWILRIETAATAGIAVLASREARP